MYVCDIAKTKSKVFTLAHAMLFFLRIIQDFYIVGDRPNCHYFVFASC